MNRMKSLGFAALLMVLGTSAHALSIGDAYYLGSIDDGIPSSTALEAGYINTLSGLPAGQTDIMIGTETYNRENSTVAGPFPAVSATGAVKDESGQNNFFADGWQYVLGKYDGPNAGSLVWFIDGLTGLQSIPTHWGQYGLSHLSLYNCASDCEPPPPRVPEPASLGILGAVLLGGAALLRRRRRIWG